MYKIITILFFVLFASLLQAEDSPSNGRLPDGRAYRVDSQGYQLVDYVAELELKVEELQNKIISINNEQKFQEVESDFSESNLMPAKNSEKLECPACNCPEIKEQEQVVCPEAPECPAIPVCNCPPIPECSCRDIEERFELQLLKANKKIDNLEESIFEKEKVINNYQLAVEDSSDQQQQVLNEVRAQVARLQERIKEKDREIDDYESLLVANKENLQEKDSKLTIATNQISKLEQQLQTLQVDLSQKTETQQALANVTETNVIVPEPVVVAVSSDKRTSAFDHLINKLSSDLTVYRQLLNKRNELYRVYQTMPIKRKISVKLSSTVTPDGYDLKKLEEGIKTATKFSELGAIQKNLFLLTRDMRKDLTVLQRITQR